MSREIAFNTLTIDQNLALKGLQDIALEDKHNMHSVWKLAKAALSAVRTLQHDLSRAHQDIATQRARIAELEQLATTDELTSLANRRGFYDTFEKELDRTNRGLTCGGLVIMIDMDNFKSINDTYGHAAGDEALKIVAQTLLNHIRTMDVAARLGGDEFCIMFSNADRIASVDRVQKLARKLNSITLKHEGHRIPVRASLGIQSYAKGDTVNSVMSRADAHMYNAKETRKKNAN